MALEKRKPRFKQLKKNLDNLSFGLIYYNPIDFKIFSLLTLLDLVYHVIIPMQLAFEFLWVKEPSDKHLYNLNFFFAIRDSPQFPYITDVINIFIALITIIVIGVSLSVQLQINDIKSRQGSLKFLSLSLTLVGRFLAPYFLIIQIIAISSYTSTHKGQIDQYRLISNSIGVAFTMIFIFMREKYTVFRFPDFHTPWAKPFNKFQIFRILQTLLFVIAVGIQDVLMDQFGFFIIIIPLLCVQLIQTMILVMHRSSFFRIIDFIHIFNNVTLLLFLIFSLILDLSKQESDVSQLILNLISIVMMTFSFYLFKQSRFINQIGDIDVKTEQQAETNIQTAILFTLYNDEDKNFVLQQAFLQHVSQCFNSKCYCQTQLSRTAVKRVSSKFHSNARLAESNDDLSLVQGEREDDESSEEETQECQLNIKEFLDKNQMKKGDILIQTLFDVYEKNSESNRLKFLKIFINTFYFQRIFRSYYELRKISKSIHSSNEKIIYAQLKFMINKEFKDYQAKMKIETYDLDKQMLIEKNHKIYSQLIYDTALLSDKFWFNLKNKEYLIQDQIQIGKNIAENYFQIKTIYDDLIEQKPDFIQLISLQITLYQSVLNFELEATQAINLLKNIQQKQRIFVQNQYSHFKRENMGQIIVSGNPNKKNKILMINRIASDYLGYPDSHLEGKNINILMPSNFVNHHDFLMEQYLFEDKTLEKKGQIKEVWLVKGDGCIEKFSKSIELQISPKEGLVMSAFIQKIERVSILNQSIPQSSSFILLTNENGYILYCSSNFKQKYLFQEDSNLQDIKINIEDMFKNLSESTDEELALGIKSKISRNSNDFTSQKQAQDNMFIDIQLKVIIYQFEKAPLMKEIIFIEEYNNGMQINAMVTDSFELDSQSSLHNVVSQKHKVNLLGKFIERPEDILEDKQSDSSSQISQSSSHQESRMHKATLDIKILPQTLVNIRRALFLFFLTLLATSFSIFGVSITSNSSFQSDSMSVKKSIYLESSLSSIRVTFRDLFMKIRYDDDFFIGSYEFYQDMLVKFHGALKEDFDYLINKQVRESVDLSKLMSNEDLNLIEIKADRPSQFNTSFSIGIYQYISKVESFLQMDKEQFKRELLPFMIRNITTAVSPVQSNAYFIIINGVRNIRDKANQITNQYLKDSSHKKDRQISISMTITLVCVAITLITTLILTPVTFNLDRDQEIAVENWIEIKDECKLQVLQKIQEFLKFYEQERRQEFSYQDSVQEQENYSQSVLAKSYHTVKTKSHLMNSSFSQDTNNDENFNKQHFKNPKKSNNSQISEPEEEFKQEQENHTEKIQSNNGINSPTRKSRFSNQGYINYRNSVNVHKRAKQNNRNSQIIVQGKSKISSHQLHDETTKLDDINVSIAQLNQSQLYDAKVIQELDSKKKEEQYNESSSVFCIRKTKKAIFIVLFSLIIQGFYIGSFFLTRNVFNQISLNFDLIRLMNSRLNCISESYSFIIETYGQNKTFYINDKSAYDYTQETCLDVEKQYEDLMKDTPRSLMSIKDFMNDLNTKKVCDYASKSNYSYIESCETFQNGLMSIGLGNVLQFLYRHAIKMFQDFSATPSFEKTNVYLDKDFYEGQTDEYTVLIQYYLSEILFTLSEKSEKSLYNNLEFQLYKFMILFSLFIVFCIVSLIFSFRYIVVNLKQSVLVSKILLKIIPVAELVALAKQDERRKSLKQ